MRFLALAAGLLPLAMSLTACGNTDRKQAAADARAANFTPPSVLSRLDYGGVITRRFHALDHDGDDAIQVAELPPRSERLKALDRDGDGKITASEWSEGMLARFDRMDLNKDGSLTSDERQAFQQR